MGFFSDGGGGRKVWCLDAQYPSQNNNNQIYPSKKKKTTQKPRCGPQVSLLYRQYMIDLFFSLNLILWLFFNQIFRCPIPQLKSLNPTYLEFCVEICGQL